MPNLISAAIAAEQVKELFTIFPMTTWGYADGIITFYDSLKTQAELVTAIATLPSIESLSFQKKKALAISQAKDSFNKKCLTTGWGYTAKQTRLPFTDTLAIRLRLDIPCVPRTLFIEAVSGEVISLTATEVSTIGGTYLESYRDKLNQLYQTIQTLQAAMNEATLTTTLQTFQNTPWE